MFLILILGAFELINFTIGRDGIQIGKRGGAVIHISFNFYLFFLLVIYSCINWKIVLEYLSCVHEGYAKRTRGQTQ